MIDPRSPAPQLPRPLRALTSRLPGWMLSAAFARVLDLGLRRRFPLDVLERLEGHAFTIIVDDANVEVSFCVEHGRFHRVADGTPASLRFRAAAWDYVALAAREADPDTLFFSRRLVVEGDTELALWVKNTLDTIEIPRTRALLRRALRGVQRAGTGG